MVSIYIMAIFKLPYCRWLHFDHEIELNLQYYGEKHLFFKNNVKFQLNL